eukprot:7695387-Pyramimonas_sp.AAC.1
MPRSVSPRPARSSKVPIWVSMTCTTAVQGLERFHTSLMRRVWSTASFEFSGMMPLTFRATIAKM